ncbi:unnamed protein product [Camellia sinensis]
MPRFHLQYHYSVESIHSAIKLKPMAMHFVLERTVKIKTWYVNPKLGFWFGSSAFNTSCIPLCRVLTVAKIATQLLAYVTIILCLRTL